MVDGDPAIIISIHSLRMEGDTFKGIFDSASEISIHSLRMEGDDKKNGGGLRVQNFNPLPPHGGRRNTAAHRHNQHRFQSTPSAWRETTTVSQMPWRKIISIHSLRMEGDQLEYTNWRKRKIFQSTPSAWRETERVGEWETELYPFQSTPSAWRETAGTPKPKRRFSISIHSLRMEGDVRQKLAVLVATAYFNPLPPHGGRRGNHNQDGCGK